MKTLVIIDDHDMLRRGLVSYLAESADWQVAGQAASLEDAAVLFQTLAPLPDLVLLDLELKAAGDASGGWGLDFLPPLRTLYSGKTPPVLVYSVYDDYAHFNAAFRAGVRGYVCKSQDTAELDAAMNKVADGDVYFSSHYALRMASVSDIMAGLTRREHRVFELVQRRCSNKEIARELDISVRTVENNLSNIYDKTGVSNRKELERL